MAGPSANGVSGAFRRLFVFGFAIATATVAVAQMYAVLAGDGVGWIDILLLALFAASFSWVSLSFWTGIAGFFALLIGRRGAGLVWPEEGDDSPLHQRTAILMATYNEDAARVFANVQAIYESVAATGHLDAFDFYVLSDSTDPDSWIAEELAWNAICQRLDAGGRIFYRKRRHNIERKSGNIADFCRRWGRHYENMVVLDADSLMTGETLVTFVRLMQANPKTALIQAPPLIVNRNALISRMLQFAGRIYGPVFSAGLAFWQLSEGNYWGHNAIIRVRPFTDHCGLPHLPGRAPFGGHILSHDFVEAALLRRAGWHVWMAPELEGSYEECPPTLLDYAKRDRRWCQGNLQHGKIILARGLHPISRLHLLTGILSYVSSPLWLAFLFAGLMLAIEGSVTEPIYFRSTDPLFPTWPIFNEALAISLFAVALGMLLLPRLLGLLLFLRDGRMAERCGGAGRLTFSVILETAFSTLLAPIMMLFQSSFVIQILLGQGVGWTTQRRDDTGMTWREAFARHIGHTLFGVAVGVTAWFLSPPLVWWLSPLIAGLLLSIPISYLSAKRSWGLWAKERGLFIIPEEVAPPLVIPRSNQIAEELEAELPQGDGLARILHDRAANALHQVLLAANPETVSEDADLLAEARRKLSAGEDLDGSEKTALLYDPQTINRSVPLTA
ncbi:glucans biosynthesis glucosyltransferase MdoH [Inquilinus sp. CAU 1745]|uniref:glucans biosynthesis glucosyltransferase MdoH n=1 Tax=Inquilinus sp. CAU 1745 TaxID=3140369 RepID=UPI00325BDFBD